MGQLTPEQKKAVAAILGLGTLAGIGYVLYEATKPPPKPPPPPPPPPGVAYGAEVRVQIRPAGSHNPYSPEIELEIEKGYFGWVTVTNLSTLADRPHPTWFDVRFHLAIPMPAPIEAWEIDLTRRTPEIPYGSPVLLAFPHPEVEPEGFKIPERHWLVPTEGRSGEYEAIVLDPDGKEVTRTDKISFTIVKPPPPPVPPAPVYRAAVVVEVKPVE